MGVWCTSGEGIDNYTVPVTCIPMPVQNEGDMDHIFTTSLTADSQNDTYITTGCENLELCMRYIDYWYTDQAEQEGYHSSDILTYALQMVPQFILGTADLGTKWDEYCAQLDSMGLADCVAVWQEAYDTVMK